MINILILAFNIFSKSIKLNNKRTRISSIAYEVHYEVGNANLLKNTISRILVKYHRLYCLLCALCSSRTSTRVDPGLVGTIYVVL